MNHHRLICSACGWASLPEEVDQEDDFEYFCPACETPLDDSRENEDAD